jgi:hypothetical protein
MGESGKGNGKVKVGDNVLPVNLLPYLAEAYLYRLLWESTDSLWREGRIQSKLVKCTHKVRTLICTSKDHNGQTIRLTLDKGPRTRVQ